MARTYINRPTGWTRTSQGWDQWLITPTDDSGPRLVSFVSAGTWRNLPNDDRAKLNVDRVVLVDGAPLPGWALQWLETAHAKQVARARDAFQAALDDAAWHESSQDGW